ncbi:DUF5067 domain-containing protein [Modestobacter sp. Leaf380]|uniref:DUF5067 domain-containing protein n=1 Tax=Modestobacter sp. Leaf380 TaxID=1736356 RepID=UPI0006F258B7|nr:DUF5067 domain-containing protein [Modestobacter sp. Leaf380]KQS68793.1 hypothetical protein ASG41_07750 [Modestobacter sp. Leaf380]
MSSPAAPRRPSRRLLVLGAAGTVVVLAALAVLLTSLGGGDETGSAAPTSSFSVSSSPEPPPTNPPTPEPSGPTAEATDLPPALTAVGLGDPAAVGDGVTGRLVSVEAVQGDGEGIGNIDGPALLVTVELTNGTAAPVSFDAAVVEAYTGSDLAPATLLDDSQAAPLAGTVDPGATVTGSYVFYVPEDDRDDVTVQVGYQAGAPYLVFRGAVG